jgi:hypothetical protein
MPRDRALRWYPRAWRNRYGDELMALVEDYSESGKLRFSDRLDLVRAGLLMHRRSRIPSRFARRRRVVARVVGCAAALFALGSITVEAATAQEVASTHHAVVVAGERGAVVVGAGGAAAFVLAKRSNNSNK